MSHTLSGNVRRVVLLAVAGLLIVASAGRAQSATTLAFIGVNVVPMDSERVLMRHTVLIQGDRIVAIDPADEASVPPAATRIDAAGKYLTPGLVDAHVGMLSGDLLGEENAAAELAVFLANGVTRLRIAAGSPFLLQLRDRLAAGESPAPGLYVSSPALSSDPERAAPRAHVVQTQFEATSAVRELRDAGYDFVALGRVDRDDVYQGIVLTTRGSRLPLVGRIPAPVTLQRALESGQQITHLDGYAEALTGDEPRPAAGLSGDGVFDLQRWQSLDAVDDDRIETVAQSTVDAEAWNIPLLAATRRALLVASDAPGIAEAEVRRFLPPELHADPDMRGAVAEVPEEQRRRYLDLRDRIVAQLHAAGAKLLAGSGDAERPLPFGFGLHAEIAGLAGAGMPPYAALRAATSAPATFLSHRGGMQAEYAIADEGGIRFASSTASEVDFGRIEVGMTADLLLLAGNPLDDVGNTRRIEGVMVGGQWLSREALDVSSADAAEQLASATVAEVATRARLSDGAGLLR